MLERIQLIQGLGLFHDATKGARHKLSPATLIYAGNGRGKSTLASVLASCANGDISVITDRQTIDGTNESSVILQFDNGHKVQYKNRKWEEQRPEISVYDSQFVENNVHSGSEVTSEQRKNLLDFALGGSAVKARANEAGATNAQQIASATIRNLTAQIQVHAGDTKVSVFRSIASIADADIKIKTLNDRLSAANRSENIQRHPLPKNFPLPTLDLKSVFGVLQTTLTNVHAEAENAVEEHLRSVDRAGASDWIRQGQEFDNHKNCPYCGQSTQGLELIRMYQSHFNKAYHDLLNLIDTTSETISRVTSMTEVDEFSSNRIATNERLELWRQYAHLGTLSNDHDDLARASISNLGELLLGLLARKAATPAENFGMETDQIEAQRLWDQYVQIIVDENEVLGSFVTRINEYKDSLKTENKENLRIEIDRIELSKVRHSADVIALLENLSTAETDLKIAEQAKKDARESLTELMDETLQKYRDEINVHLRNLGAGFSIDELKHNYKGGSPRTEYQINLRGKPIKLSGGSPSFATALSEGDKRTMAFAFFAASTLGDPDLGNKIIVIDDPMSSLDKSRRGYTTELLVRISDLCSQLIVLAHDATFLRQVRQALKKADENLAVTTLAVVRVPGEYSDFALSDLDRECESPYYTNYRTVSQYVSGDENDHKKAAISLRLLMEGYLHRRYPGQITDGLTLGKAISQIDDAKAPSPLVHAQPFVKEMRSLNIYASKFHHDTNPDFFQESAEPAEMATYGDRVLRFVHGAS